MDYTADPINGFNAVVSKSAPSVHVAPVHHAPAPVVHHAAPIVHHAAPIVKHVAPIYHHQSAPLIHKQFIPAAPKIVYASPGKRSATESINLIPSN